MPIPEPTATHTPATKPGAVLTLLDKAIDLQTPLARRYVEHARASDPDLTPEQAVRRLSRTLHSATISAGAGVGAMAAAPGVGTGVALAVSGGESVAFLNATVLYILTRAQVQGIELHEVERRRTLVMAVMLGESGAAAVGTVAERTGQHWARQIVRAIPMSNINAVNKVLGRHFVTKYGTKKGIIVLGRVVPFGIGAAIGGAANGMLCQGVVQAANRAFGAAPVAWPDDDRMTPVGA